MKISLNWIKKYIPDLGITSYEDLWKNMVAIGLDIESIESEAEKFNNFIVAEVMETGRHPNADKLTLCKVNTGSEVLSVVCGAPNVAPGQKVCLAKTGAIIPNGGFEIKKNKIRGELSEGMICAEDELGLSGDHTGIMVLKADAKPGQPFSDYIGCNDYIVEIGITPNRGDLFSHIGIAREIASIYDKKIVLPEIKINESKERSDEYAKITIVSANYCKRFTGRVVKNVQIKESPEWLKKSLLAIGLRPINNIVDITNYVMMETGQPLHAFDYEKIRGKEIIVKTAKEGDKFTTLDSKERILNSESLMVCDGEGYSAIAGIMGGESSEITEKTKNVFIESAYFDSVCIRLNSKKLGLQTDASQRFERGVDINNVPYASGRAAMLMQEITGGEVLKDIIDVYPEEFEKLKIGIRSKRAGRIIGLGFSEDKIIELLEKIEIKFTGKDGDKLIFEIPEFRRNDLTREIDLIEEVARIYRYDNIENQYNFTLDVSSHIDYNDKIINLKKETKEHFIGRGFNEIISYSQQDERKVKYFSESFVKIENPNSVEMNVMRVNLLYGMLSTIKNNINNSGKGTPLKLFEIGKVFNEINGNYTEENHLCFALCGKTDFHSFDAKEKSFDYFDLKGELEMFLSKMNLESLGLFYYNSRENGGSNTDIILNDKVIGNIYILSEEILKLFDIDDEVFLAEIKIDDVLNLTGESIKFSEISKFPSVKRDLALIVNKEIKFEEIKETIKSSGGAYLRSLSLFDIYSDEKLGAGKKSMAYSLEFSSKEKTLTDEEINKQVQKIIKTLEKKLGITLRN
jgi:phenylalanyl-tRNA synthetase beta chain